LISLLLINTRKAFNPLRSIYLLAFVLAASPSSRAGYCDGLIFPAIPFPVPEELSDVFKHAWKPEKPRIPFFYADGILDLRALSYQGNGELMLAYNVPGKGLAGLSFSTVAPAEFGPVESLVLKHPDLDLSTHAQAAFAKMLSEADHRYRTPLAAKYDPFHAKILQTQFQGKPVQTLWVFDLSKPRAKSLPTYLRTIEDDFLNFVFEQYSLRMGMETAVSERLRSISKGAMSRTTLIVGSPAEFLHFNHPGGWGSATYAEAPLASLQISGGLSVVTSKGVLEKLPLESFIDFEIPRKQGETIAEIGRFVVTRRGVEDLTAEITVQVASILRGMSDIDRVIIEADEARARMFGKLGFEPIHERVNFQGKKEYILSISTDALYKNALNRGILSKDNLFEILRPGP
jgi:hypothetical protein